MSTDLTHEVAEALYNLEPLVTGYGDMERKLTWPEAQMEGFGQKYINRAEAAIPIILDAAKDIIREEQLHDATDRADQAYNLGVHEAAGAIDKLRTSR